MLADERLAAIKAGSQGNGCGVCLTFADYPAEHQPGCDECIFASREGTAILDELIEARIELTRLRAALDEISHVADSIWVDNVTGAADVSDPTPLKAEWIMKRCKGTLAPLDETP